MSRKEDYMLEKTGLLKHDYDSASDDDTLILGAPENNKPLQSSSVGLLILITTFVLLSAMTLGLAVVI